MISIDNYQNAYKEVYVILKNTRKEDIEKIPESIIKMIEIKINKEYVFELDENIDFSDQKILKETKVILSYIFLNYWATEEQEKKIKLKFKQDITADENKKSEKYLNDVFKNRNQTSHEKNINDEVSNKLVVYKKENIFTKIAKKILNLFKRTKE